MVKGGGGGMEVGVIVSHCICVYVIEEHVRVNVCACIYAHTYICVKINSYVYTRTCRSQVYMYTHEP